MRAKEFINEAWYGDLANMASSAGNKIKGLFGNNTFSVSMPSGTRGHEVSDIQSALQGLGYSVGPPGVDGIIGPYTRGAIAKFNLDNGINTNNPNQITQDTVDSINKALAAKPEIAKTLQKSTDGNDKPSSYSPLKSGGASGVALKDPKFMDALNQTASNLGINPKDLLGIMKLESSLNPQAVNSNTGATGLIQFMPNTATGLGTSTKALYGMSASEQMPYVELYLKKAGVKPGMDIGDLYMAVFMPAMMGKKDDHVISTAGKKVYDYNKGLDTTKDGVLTVADVKQAAQRFA